MLLRFPTAGAALAEAWFQWAPTLGGECYPTASPTPLQDTKTCFNGHPPLGVNATRTWDFVSRYVAACLFQWAPTLGGECYTRSACLRRAETREGFNGHPPLGVNATFDIPFSTQVSPDFCFNGHPPLGVNATIPKQDEPPDQQQSFNGHPPLGVNATSLLRLLQKQKESQVSMGTHPWG